jgi:L,D-peptidoglycan transpeptidase YkuD (ErfK/YbiS/YcfS/YnhG family)
MRRRKRTRLRRLRLLRTCLLVAVIAAIGYFAVAHLSEGASAPKADVGKRNSTSVPTSSTPKSLPTSTSRPTSQTTVTRTPPTQGVTTTSVSQACTLIQPLYTGEATQLITVNTSEASSTYATLSAWELHGKCWVQVYGPFTARLGYSGMSANKHEGDGATPEGTFDFESTMYGNAPDPGVSFPYHQLVCGDWWDEDSASPTYNTFQHVPCSETDPPFANGASEALWTETRAYPSFAVINYNPDRIPGAGSAIFLHADVGGPTDGCISLPLGELDEVLDWMTPVADPTIMIGLSPEVLGG